MKLMKRDFLILESIHKFGFCLSRHVKYLAQFPSERTTDRRLKLLVDSGYLDRKKIIYGIPYLYFLTRKGKLLINKVPNEEKIRLDIINHNIFLLDYLPILLSEYQLSIENMMTEKELHSADAFQTRRHHPDLAFISSSEESEHKEIAVEFELTAKDRTRLINNIKKNYLEYEAQLWIVPMSERKIIKWISNEINNYSGLEVITVAR